MAQAYIVSLKGSGVSRGLGVILSLLLARSSATAQQNAGPDTRRHSRHDVKAAKS